MGQGHKAFLELRGRSLLAHVIDRLQDHVDPLMLSCAAETGPFAALGLPLVPDLLPGYQGPLTGLYSALQYLADSGQNSGQDSGLVVCPCDAPFIPSNLVKVLLESAQGETKPVVVISFQGVLQPTFSLWQTHHLPVIHDAVVNRGRGGLKQVLITLPHEIVEWDAAEPSPFFNVNTPEDLENATLWLDRLHT
jgi:molybdopterin-guanine dinucleotide biosynthesis protein A